jgi:predicted aspartyl protease
MPSSLSPRSILLGIAVFVCLPCLAKASQCSVAQPHPLTEEQLALIRGDLAQAETLYRQKASQQPKNYELEAGLVRTLLAEQKVDEAESAVKAALVASPQSVELLTAQAEVQYRQGTPWDMEKTLQLAQQVTVCYPRLHLAFAKYFRFNSMYASALREVKVAHQLDPYDPDIRRIWIPTLPLKERIEELKTYLATKDADVDSLRRAQLELAVLESRADSQTSSCHLASPVNSTDIPFTPIMADALNIRGWGLDVYFNDHKSRLQVDTGASGLYVSRPVAEHAGLKPITRSEASGVGSKGPQGGYIAYADSIKIGGLEFRNCIVEVSDRRSIVDTDGLIGMDVFSEFLVTLDFPWHKMTVGPLPPYPGTSVGTPSLDTQEDNSSNESGDTPPKAAKDAATTVQGPHDRYIAPEMQKWTTVYRIGHDMVVPTALNSKKVRLFIIDTGAQRTSISPSAAREVTRVSHDSSATVKGVSGAVENVYSGDSVVFRFAHLQQEQDGVLSFDTAGVSKNMGTEISGFIGFDLLRLLVVKIDYRDGLMDFQYSSDRGYQHIR